MLTTTVKTAKTLVAPTLHLNGSGAQNLTVAYSHAIGAVDAALSDVLKTTPHGRDYYLLPDGDAALKLATEQHDDRVARLISVRDELTALMSIVLDQHYAKKDARPL